MQQRYTYKSIGLAILIIFVAALGVGLFFTKPAWSKYSDKKDELAAVNAKNADLKAARDSIQSFLQSYNNKQAEAAKANLAVPAKSDNMPDFLTTLSSLAAQSGVTLSNLTVTYLDRTQGAPNSIQSVPVNFAASGNYTALKAFVTRIESSLRLTDIVHLNVISQQGNANLLQYQINLKIYYQK